MASTATLTWTTTSVPVSSALSSVASSLDGKKIAVGGIGTYIYTSTDGGTTWVARTTSGSRNWFAITSSADGTKLAAADGNQGYIYTSTDSGATWTARTGPGGRSWTAIASSADGTKLIAGAFGAALYTSSDSGVTWIARGAGASGSWFWQSVTSSADGTKLAAVTNYYYGYVYTSADSGATWTQHSWAVSSGLNSITSSADGTKLAVTDSYDHIYMSTNGGSTWTDRTPSATPGQSTNKWTSVTSSSDGTKLAAVTKTNYYIYTSSDSGATWNIATQIPENVATADAAYGYRQPITYSSDGSTIVSVFSDNSGKVYLGKDRDTNCDWVGYHPPSLAISSPYPGQAFAAGSSFRIQGSVTYHMTTASAENVSVGWSNRDGSQKGTQSLYSTSSSCSANGCPNSDNTSSFSLAGYAASSTAIIVPSAPGTYRFYAYATSTNGCTTDAMSAYQDYVVSQAGQCGTKDTSPVTQFDKNHPVSGTDCSAGTIASQNQAGSSRNWQCAGVNGGATSTMCSYIYNDPADGLCGADSGVPTKSAPRNLCYVGSPTSPILSSSGYAWSCQGSYYGADASCSAPLPDISVASFRLVSSLASTTSSQCTAEWNVSAATGSASCVLNGLSVPSFSSGYPVPAGTETLTCTQGSASYSKSARCAPNPKYREI
jgi:photosystem II stability/assembly factor-like uncharacterized protein